MALNFIPNSGQSLGQTRNGIRQNFVDIDTAFTIDHVSYNAAGQGKHNKVTLPVQVADATTLANEMAIYTKNVAGNPALFLRNFNNGTVVDWTTATKANTGTLTLPSGIIIKWGRSACAAGAATVNFATAFPTAIFACWASPSTATTGINPITNNSEDYTVRIYTYTTAQLLVVGFQLNVARTRVNTDFTWLAIGN